MADISRITTYWDHSLIAVCLHPRGSLFFFFLLFFSQLW